MRTALVSHETDLPAQTWRRGPVEVRFHSVLGGGTDHIDEFIARVVELEPGGWLRDRSYEYAELHHGPADDAQ